MGRMLRWVILFLALVVVACTPRPSPIPTGAPGELELTAVAGPVCPVETIPADPACEPRPVPGARVLVSPGDGRDIVVAEGTTDDDGMVRLELPPGDYIVSGADVDGLMGRPDPATVTIAAGELTSVTLAYDTGIR